VTSPRRARLDRLRLLALGVGLLPLMALPLLGAVWLWQNGAALWWLGALLGCSALGFGLHRWLERRARALLRLDLSGPEPHWPPSEEAAWAKVEDLARDLNPADWPLGDSARLLQLGRRTVEAVAHHYHPKARAPLLELSVPHLLRIIELAARDVGREVREQIPFSDRVSVGDLLQANRWRESAQGVYQLWRAGRMALNPIDGLLREAADQLRRRAFSAAQQDVQRWLLQECVRRTGRYAIEVYSGRLRFADDDPSARATPASATALAADPATPGEPLRILLLGQAKAGKSSLVNALSGELRAPVDVLPATPALYPYRLQRNGLTAALLIDSPGLDAWSQADLLHAASEADLILWVCAAHRADRAVDRAGLDALRADFAAHPARRRPPMLTVLTQIDRLRPIAEWEPPYDLRDPDRPKARNIAEALAAVAEDLDVPVQDIVPVCLAEGRRYNVDDALWAAILDRQESADRVRRLRCLDQARRAEQRALRWKQLRGAGRVLAQLPKRLR